MARERKKNILKLYEIIFYHYLRSPVSALSLPSSYTWTFDPAITHPHFQNDFTRSDFVISRSDFIQNTRHLVQFTRHLNQNTRHLDQNTRHLEKSRFNLNQKYSEKPFLYIGLDFYLHILHTAVIYYDSARLVWRWHFHLSFTLPSQSPQTPPPCKPKI